MSVMSVTLETSHDKTFLLKALACLNMPLMPETLESLLELLRQGGIPIEAYGQGTTKRVEDLHAELLNGSSLLAWQDGQLPVFKFFGDAAHWKTESQGVDIGPRGLMGPDFPGIAQAVRRQPLPRLARSTT